MKGAEKFGKRKERINAGEYFREINRIYVASGGGKERRGINI